jgi:hypothetical protein
MTTMAAAALFQPILMGKPRQTEKQATVPSPVPSP